MTQNETMPMEDGLDNSIKLLKEGYRFILNRRQTFQSNVFQTRLLGEQVIYLLDWKRRNS